MENITVNKNDLRTKLLKNRAQHISDYADAMNEYSHALVAELERLLAEAKAGHPVGHLLDLKKPEHFTSSFDTALQMLEWETGNTVTLDISDFRRFVQNEWEWQKQWTANTSSYLNKP